MIVKLKCVDNTECEGYLTLNKEFIANVFSSDGYRIIDDCGDELFVSINGVIYAHHGKWEVIKDDC